MPYSPMSSSVNIVSKSTVVPDRKSVLGDLKLSVSDLPMLSCHYIQKGGLFTRPQIPIHSLLSLLKQGLSQTLSRFPPLAGRLTTDEDGHVFLTCNDAGADFIHANAGEVFIREILGPAHVPEQVREFFAFDGTVSYLGHFRPILTVQVTELADGVFIGCAVNHAVIDGTSFWNFFNTFAEACRGVKRISRPAPDFSRDSVLISKAVLKLPEGGPKVTFSNDAPLSERIFSFSREAVLKLKDRTNNRTWYAENDNEILAKQSNDTFSQSNNNKNEILAKQSNDTFSQSNNNKNEILAKQSNDTFSQSNNNKVASIIDSWLKNGVVSKPQHAAAAATVQSAAEISSFQSLCALLWRAVTRARKLPSSKTTTFRMAVNCRHRLEPRLDPYYFGNAIQSVPTCASAGEVLSRDLRWCADQLNRSVRAHDNANVRRFVKDWESSPRCFPLGNPDGASITMGSSPRFPMYDNDFGWGRPLAVRSGRANKFDGKISAFPGRDGTGTVDLEVVLSPETMSALENDPEFMQYVSS